MPAQPRAFTTHRCPDSFLLSSELRGSSAMSSTGKPPPAPALGGSTSTYSDTSESHSQPLLLLPAKSSSQPLLLLCVSPALPCSSAAKPLPAPGSSTAATESWHQHRAHDWHAGTGSAKRAPGGLICVTVQQDVKDGAWGSCHAQICP